MLVLTRHPYVLQASVRVHNEPRLLLHSLHFPQTEGSSPSGSYSVAVCEEHEHLNHILLSPNMIIRLDYQTHRCISVLWISTINDNVTGFKKRNLQYMEKSGLLFYLGLVTTQTKTVDSWWRLPAYQWSHRQLVLLWQGGWCDEVFWV